MKTLYLVRHGKSSWEEPGLSDQERPLTEKGIRKTDRIAEYLAGRNNKLDLIYCSPATRAKETAKIIANKVGTPENKICFERKIYDAYYDRILDLIYAAPNDADSLMILGHNPTITQVANLFLNPGIELMPTSAVVCISFDCDKWENIPSATPVQEFVVFPKMLK
ncbi:MAG: phosphohistidine phosphatase SixA [Bacteroidota bacterium]|nr:phosphohistidine phosphatase SixA [Bacteroidota bacterium]